MPRVTKRKEHPLSMRLPEADIAIIDRAASLRGRSRTDFVREAAVRAAEDVLREWAPIRMSAVSRVCFPAHTPDHPPTTSLLFPAASLRCLLGESHEPSTIRRRDLQLY